MSKTMHVLQVWMLQPIALEEQARELLKAGDFDQALQLADVAAAEGAPWVEDAYAEAAFLLIHGRHPLPCTHQSSSTDSQAVTVPGASRRAMQYVQIQFEH